MNSRNRLAWVQSAAVTWDSLLEAVATFVETCPAGELAVADAERLASLAEAVRMRLEERPAVQSPDGLRTCSTT